MAAREIQYAVTETEGGVTVVSHLGRWMIDSADDLDKIVAAAPGSVAFSADGSLIYMFDGTDWKQWGGSSDA